MTVTPPNTICCPVCNSTARVWCKQQDWEYFTSEDYYTYYKCDDCYSICIHPVPENQLDKIYPSHYYSFDAPSRNIVFKIKEWLDKRLFKKVLKSIPGDQLSVLDIGGGSGWLLDLVRKTDSRVTATSIIDINEQCANIARKKGHTFYTSRIEDFESQEKYNLVIMLNLIEHVASPKKVLEKVSRILAPGGIILIKTPNSESLDARLFRNNYWGGLHCPRHWTIFSKQSINKITKEVPLQVKELHFTQGAPFWTYSLLVKLYGKKLKASKRPLINHPLFPVFSVVFAAVDFVRGVFVPTSQMFIIMTHRNE